MSYAFKRYNLNKLMDLATEEPTKKLIIRTLDKAAKAKTSSKADDLIRDAVEVIACLWLSLWLALSD